MMIQFAHMVVTGPIDKDQIFYLRSRGIDEQSAVDILIEAFYQDIKYKMSIDQ